MIKLISFLTIYVLIFSCKSRNLAHSQQKAIFDSDDRKDLFEVQDSKILNFAKNVALLSDDEGIANPLLAIDAQLVGQSFNRYVRSQYGKPLCPDERFRNQSVMGFCTGFLVSKNVLATAAHCIKGRPIESIKVFLDVKLNGKTDVSPTVVPSKNIYFMARVLKAELGVTQVGDDFVQMDYALVELNRDVQDFRPWLGLNPQSFVEGQAVQMLGHPSGLAMKYVDQGVVKQVGLGEIATSLDTFGGNSGGPVFSKEKNSLAGIMINVSSQDSDYMDDAKGTCAQPKIYPSDSKKVSSGVFPWSLVVSRMDSTLKSRIFENKFEVDSDQRKPLMVGGIPYFSSDSNAAGSTTLLYSDLGLGGDSFQASIPLKIKLLDSAVYWKIYFHKDEDLVLGEPATDLKEAVIKVNIIKGMDTIDGSDLAGKDVYFPLRDFLKGFKGYSNN